MGAWLKDLTHARRRFSQSPGFVAAVVISIGLGIAANSAIFSTVSRFVLRPALVGDPTTLLSLQTTEPFWLICTAWLGINTAPFSVLRTSFTSSNWPGQKWRSGLPIVPRRLTVPLPFYTALSRNSTCPTRAASSPSEGSRTAAFSMPDAICY